ncbi:MAG TPA: ribonuclease Y [Elusimicrobia bacterium]|nr:MAG: ribonuclease Y [Elusimicrobia bacterium RIFOXYA12_FULL_49_49]OGS11001.1 MAG: ribonuclease Y [Elusimicrobia bacterium RIFOXYB1_FULL_48_9]OGS15162.1 MAG: ribonuclease Y [Elusimicrobia bacterium RIFOXYA2_FULL_47_53]OGS29782.1 MAG: ribonuclease Y [Elusimicrobia bacterium RIFOXYB2_FULL_46_23]HBU70265.1 ribonuclease Y [Elusimicrobiota bacterium]
MDIYLIAIAMLLCGVILGYVIRVVYARTQMKSAEHMAKQILSEAQIVADAKKKEGLLEVKEIMERERREFDRETRERKQEIQNIERRVNQREETAERKFEIMDKKERELQQREKNITLKEKNIEDESREISRVREEQKKILERIAGMSAEEAKKILMQSLEEEARKEGALLAKRIEQETRETADKKSKEILSVAIQRVAAEHTADITTTTVPITNDEMKGRVIGREGRNIRAFEQATGVDLIIDDTPEAITISAFDGVRRQIARIALERLISDGRIHPARIEEVVNKVKNEMENTLKETGEQAALEAGVPGLHPEILKLLGKLKYRTSYGQNQLQHTLEVTWLSGALAGELGVDIAFCKRAGLMHDLGKAVDHEVEGTHHQISADVAKKYGEGPKMINAIISHHEGIAEPQSAEAFIVAAADAISAARPGARRESIELYLKRLEKLEKLATSFRGVASAYAIQAGREVRILVEPEDVNDQGAQILAHDIAKKVEQELEYPGQIKITVIREVRAQEVAK